MKERVGKSVSNRRFLDYLYNMQLFQTLTHSLRASSIEQYRQIIKTGSIDHTETQENDLQEISEVQEFLEELRKKQVVMDSDPESETEYLRMKNEYFTGLKANLNPLYSQTVANQLMVLHDVFIERSTTQKMLEKSTLLPRSTISELLSVFVEIGVLRVTKREGSRIKLYQPAISFTDFMLSYSERLGMQMVTAKATLSEFIATTRKLSSKSSEARYFLELLESFLKAYSYTEEFTKTFKVRMVTKLMQAHNRGFVFI
jgi:hypothetical protein